MGKGGSKGRDFQEIRTDRADKRKGVPLPDTPQQTVTRKGQNQDLTKKPNYSEPSEYLKRLPHETQAAYTIRVSLHKLSLKKQSESS